jgi:hypothetical protein
VDGVTATALLVQTLRALGPAMWLLLAGPLALLVGLPFHREGATPEERGRENAK